MAPRVRGGKKKSPPEKSPRYFIINYSHWMSFCTLEEGKPKIFCATHQFCMVSKRVGDNPIISDGPSIGPDPPSPNFHLLVGKT